METKTVYTCAICGKDYESIDGRIKCETTCLEKQKELVAKAEKEKNKKEQETRRQEVAVAIRHASSLLAAYMDDYGSFYYNPTDFEEDATETPVEKPIEKTVSQTETTLKEPWCFKGWPFPTKLFDLLW